MINFQFWYNHVEYSVPCNFFRGAKCMTTMFASVYFRLTENRVYGKSVIPEDSSRDSLAKSGACIMSALSYCKSSKTKGVKDFWFSALEKWTNERAVISEKKSEAKNP